MVLDPFERNALTTQSFQDTFSRAILSVGPQKQMEIDGLRASGAATPSQTAVLDRMGGIIEMMLAQHGMGVQRMAVSTGSDSARSALINFMVNVYGSAAWTTTFDEVHAAYLNGEIEQLVESAVSDYYDVILARTASSGPVAQAIGMPMEMK